MLVLCVNRPGLAEREGAGQLEQWIHFHCTSSRISWYLITGYWPWTFPNPRLIYNYTYIRFTLNTVQCSIFGWIIKLTEGKDTETYRTLHYWKFDIVHYCMLVILMAGRADEDMNSKELTKIWIPKQLNLWNSSTSMERSRQVGLCLQLIRGS
jgi:hypothetical protein